MDQDTAGPRVIGRRPFLAAGLAALALPTACRTAVRSGAPGDIDHFITAEMQRAAIPGLAVGFARDGAVSFARGYGLADIARHRPVTADTLFHIASLTKTVTATAVMRLAEQGRLRLDEPVESHLDFPLANPHHPDVPITVRHLLMHVSSISDARYYEVDFRQRGADATLALGDFLKGYLVPGGRTSAAEACFSQAAPGGAWDYSNVGYGLLGYLASRIGGEDMREQTRQRIFAPLGMRHTRWTLRDTPEPLRATPYDRVEGVLTAAEPVGMPDWPAGSIRSSVADFTRFVAASANAGSAYGARIIGAPALAQMLDMRTPPELPSWLTGQGLGWMAATLDGAVRLEHWGGDPGVFTAAYIDPASRRGVVVFTNATVSAEAKTAVKNIAGRFFRDDLPAGQGSGG
jgi:CubicO group peptidase (beta-lactamase class C family)